MSFKKIDPKDIERSALRLFDEDWALITAGVQDSYNTMTISWGTLGWLWYKPVVTTYVRESRHTFKFTEGQDYFTVSIFEHGKYRKELGELGSRSGRDIDKMHYDGLTPFTLDGHICFAEARYNLVCKKLYSDMLKRDNFLYPQTVEKCYGGSNEGDFHMVYTAEIVSAYERE